LGFIACATFLTGQVVYEDFEGDDTLSWEAVQGEFEVVENPFTDGINASENVGSYTKDTMAAFSLFQAELDEPIDLSTNNQFSIQINSPVPTAFILKLEGPDGAIERRQNLPVGTNNVWREYTFDFSDGADLEGLNKILIFFDPGVAESGDTYLFDNLVARPAGPCAGVETDPMVIDNFECQRNATYGQGWDRLSVIANPDPDDVNPSDSVGQYLDPEGQPFAALVIDNGEPIDLSTRNVYKVKIWSPQVVDFGFKLEGGASPAVEKTDFTVPDIEEWVEYTIDFSDQANANHTRFVIFFNFAQDAAAGDVYYVDDIVRMEAAAPEAIEDFEDGGNLTWVPLNSDEEIHGTFEIISNPDQGTANDSDNVGAHTKGSSNVSTLQAFIPGGIDLSADPQLNMQVWAPMGASSVEMLLVSPLEGVKSATAEIPATEEWIDLAFDFTEFQNIEDFEQIQLRFNPGEDSPAGPYYFDNIAQGASTVDPCEGIEPEPNIIDNFECQRNAVYSAGFADLEVVANPDISSGNNSSLVGQYTDPAGEAFAALVVQYEEPIDLSVFNQFSMKIWSPNAVPIGFKLEDGIEPPIEIVQDVTETESWQTYTVDFSGAAGGEYKRLVLFFNFGNEPEMEDIYYIDDLEWTRAPYTACVETYENQPALTNWAYFANGDLNDTEFEVVDNPSPDAVNDSESVGIFLESATGETDLNTFAGMFTTLEAPIILPASKTMRMKVLAEDEAMIGFKLEGGQDGVPNSGDNNVAYTTPGEWQELTWNYPDLPEGGQYMVVSLIFDFETIPDETEMYYFDDIVVGDASCVITSTNNIDLEALRVAPNPADQFLLIENGSDLEYVEVHNSVGQFISRTLIGQSTNQRVDIADLDSGIYLLTGYDDSGRLIANAKFVKQ